MTGLVPQGEKNVATGAEALTERLPTALGFRHERGIACPGG